MIVNKITTQKPKVSVIIATYNRAYFVSCAIDSVLSQTFKDFELIMVDDGSIDNTSEVLKKYSSSIYYIYQENKGRAEARNTGIKVARGNYIAFLDDDDIWLPEKLEKQVIFLDSHPDIGLVHTVTDVIDEGGRLLQKETRERFRFYKKAMKIGYTYEGMSRMCIMFLSAVMLKKECLGKVGPFDPRISAFEDWDFYLRFALKYRIGTIPETLVRFRMHEAHSTKEEFIQGRIMVSMNHLAMIESGDNDSFRNLIRYNFYTHLANVYYIDKQQAMFRAYALKALKLNPWRTFQSRLGIHLMMTLLPHNLVRSIRNFKEILLNERSVCPERIIPKETFGGPLAAHLKRYDFAKAFCTNKIVLDAGCGVGYGSHYLARLAKEVIGVDTSEQAIVYAKEHYQRNNIQFNMIDVQKLAFPDQYFDIVCSFETLEHLDDPERFVSEVKRVLKKKGIFIVSTPNLKKRTNSPKNPYHKVEFSREELERLLRKYFLNVAIFGQRRLQSPFHYYLQKIDFFHLRALLPTFVRREICHTIATRPWDETGLEDFVISKEWLKRATELIGVCNL